MSVSKIVAAAASGASGGAGLDVDEVFSTFLYEGNNSTQTITNNIDLSGEGGLVWIKERTAAEGHRLIDTARGNTKMLRSDAAGGNYTLDGGFNDFTSTGFTLKADGGWSINSSSEDYVSWTWRKAPKFFDIVTYTGNSTENRKISHNLGCEVGMILVKRTSSSRDWVVYHRGNTAAPETDILKLNTTDATSDLGSAWYDTAPTSTEFTLGDQIGVNANGETYVAYLFAHNNNDGEFGPDGDADIIKCGSYTGTGASGNKINLGFEPQWLLIKDSNDSNSWVITDTMRGLTSSTAAGLFANVSNAEFNSSGYAAALHADGFTPTGSNGNNTTYIYMAIRRGPLAAPDDATKVFAPIAYTTTDGSWQDRILQSNFTTDLAINGYRNISDGGTHTFVDRLRGYGTILRSHQTNGESDRSGDYHPWPQTGQSVTSNEWSKYNAGNGLDYYNYQWKRAPSFFDVIAYTGGGYNTNVKHNLTVTPELCIAKSRTTNSVVDDWYVWSSHSGDGNDTLGFLNSTGTTAVGFHASSPSSTDLYLHGNVAYSGYPYIMYLFATVAGVSKVGSFVSDGNPQNIDCGFSSGARFVLIKKSSGTFNWRVWDSVRGIVAGDDPYIFLDTTAAEATNGDWIDPHSSGFSITTAFSNGTYIFYAIA